MERIFINNFRKKKSKIRPLAVGGRARANSGPRAATLALWSVDTLSTPSVPENLSSFTFIIFCSGPRITLTHSHSHFILILIYKRTHMPPTFSNSFSINFLKFVLESSSAKF